MAGSSNLFSRILIIIAIGALLATPRMSAVELPTEEYPGFFKYLERCGKKFDVKCGQKVYFAIYFGNVTLTDQCCVNMVNKLGKRCHEGMLRFTLLTRTFKDSISDILSRAKKIWNNCSSMACYQHDN